MSQTSHGVCPPVTQRIIQTSKKKEKNSQGSCEPNLTGGLSPCDRSEIVNLDAVDGFEGNCYYIGKNPLYATGDYRQRMEGVFVKAKQQ